jgi:hypothetical protein
MCFLPLSSVRNGVELPTGGPPFLDRGLAFSRCGCSHGREVWYVDKRDRGPRFATFPPYPPCAVLNCSVSRESGTLRGEMRVPEISPKAFAESSVSSARITYACSGCRCRFPETRPPQGRTPAEAQRLEKIHVEREFAQHICWNRGR